MGVYGKSADALKALSLTDLPSLDIADASGQRYLLMDWGYSASFSESSSHPVGLLGTISFGVDAKRNSVFAVLHRFDENQGAHQVIEDVIANWLLPRHVTYDGHDVNLKPGTWLLAEADGSLAFNLATSLGWNMSFAKDAKLLGVTHNLSAKIDASLKATLGFSVSGKYVVVVGRAGSDASVRLQLFKQSNKGLNFGLNLNVGFQGSDPAIPGNDDEFIKSVFGVQGLQVLHDLQEWTDPSTDLGKKLAGLTDQTVLDLLKNVTDFDPATEFDKAKQAVTNALGMWASLPAKVSSMLWSFLEKKSGPDVTDFKTFLTGLADPATGKETLEKIIQGTTFGDTPEGQFLEAVADRGLLSLANNLHPVSVAAGKVLNLLNGGLIAKLQTFINKKLDLKQIQEAVADADPSKVDQWMQNRLGNFLDKSLKLADLKDIQKAIQTLDAKAADYYKTAVQALTKRYRLEFATTYQKTTTDTALIDITFDLSKAEAMEMFTRVVAQSKLDTLLTRVTRGVSLNHATLTHEISRKGTVELHMPLFDFTRTHLNDAMTSLTAEDQGGRLLLYQVEGNDKVTIANRAASQLSVLASLKVAPGQTPTLETDGSIAYEMRQVKANMRPLDLEGRTSAFIHEYLSGLFSGGDASIRSFYTDFDTALTAKTHDQSNHLGDMAVSMQLSLPATVLDGWFHPRTASQLRTDRMNLSRSLQRTWKDLLPSLYFNDLGKYQFNESVAALLVWSSLYVSTSIDFEDPVIKGFNTNTDVFWDWPEKDLRRAIAYHPNTIANLSGRLSGIQGQLLEENSKNAKFFAPSLAGRFIEMALEDYGDRLLCSLLFTEAQLVTGASDALKHVSSALDTAAAAPTEAIRLLADFAANLTDTFDDRVRSIYTGMSGHVIGPMLLVQSSAALGSVSAKPAGMLTLYALKPGHTFELGKFIDGEMPPPPEVALTQTLVALKQG